MKQFTRTQLANVLLLLSSTLFFSCKKEINNQTGQDLSMETANRGAAKASNGIANIISTMNVVRVHNNDLSGDTWEEVQIDQFEAGPNSPSYPTDHVSIKCAPPYQPGLNRGAAYLELPKPDGSTLRRVRMNNNAYSGTRLEDLTALNYSTYIDANKNQSAPGLVLQIDVNEDGIAEYNLAFEPKKQSSDPIVFNEIWQEWDALNGLWQVGIANVPIPAELVNVHFTLAQFLEIIWPKAQKIINTAPLGVSNGGGIRFTIGGGNSDFDNFKGYVDAFIIGIRGQEKPTLYDFVCDNSKN